MAPPRRITVGPLTFTVEAVDLPAADGGTLFGECVLDQCRIRLRRGMDPAFERMTMWHEVKHAVAWVTGADYAADNDHGDEELMVRQLTAVELDVLRRNPKLVAYLTQ